MPPCKTLSADEFTGGLLVRNEYISILAQMKSSWLTESVPLTRSLILGTPGTGKSAFGIYCLLDAISKRENVAFRPLFSPEQLIYFTHSNDICTFSRSPAPNAFYNILFDGKEFETDLSPSLKPSSLTLFASPAHSNYNEFKKVNCKTFYLNPWSRHEIESLISTSMFQLDTMIYHRFQ